MSSEFFRRQGLLRKDISSFNKESDLSAKWIIETAVNKAYTLNSCRVSVGTIVLAMHEHELLQQIDPVFAFLSSEDIMAAYKMGRFKVAQAEVRPSLSRSTAHIFDLAKKFAHSRPVDEYALLAAVLEDDKQYVGVSNMDLLHGIAELRSESVATVYPKEIHN
jgi:hypothetical protein